MAVEGVADAVRLGVFDGDGGDCQIAQGRAGELRRVLRADDGGEGFEGGDLDVVAALGEGDAVDGAGFLRGGRVGGIDLEDEIFAVFLFGEEREGFVAV